MPANLKDNRLLRGVVFKLYNNLLYLESLKVSRQNARQELDEFVTPLYALMDVDDYSLHWRVAGWGQMVCC